MNTKNYYQLIVAVAAAFCSTQAFSQMPAGLNYQAALRTTAGAPMVSQTVTLRFGIYSGIGATLKVYEENQSLTTSAQGLVNCVIGKGTTIVGDLKTINWGGNQHHLKVEVNSGTGFVDMGTQQLISVPYAQHANTAISSRNSDTAGFANAISGNVSISPSQITGGGANVGELLRWDGAQWINSTENPGLSAGNGVDISGGVINTPWTVSGSNIHNNNSGYVGIGTNSPTSPLHIKGANGVRATDFSGYGWEEYYRNGSYKGYLGIYNDSNDLDFGTSGSGQDVNIVTGASPRLTVANGGNVGIGTVTPSTKLEVLGTTKTNALQVVTGASAGKVLTSDGSGNATWQTPTAASGTLATMVSNSGGGFSPSTTLGFLSAPLSVSITSNTQKVIITSSKAMGSTIAGGACCLNLTIGYNTNGAQTPITTIGGGSYGYACLQNERNNYTLSTTITGLAAGTYYFGLTGIATSTNWNSNEFSYTSIMVFN